MLYLEMREIINFLYLFSWDKIQRNDNNELIEFIGQKFSIDWVKTAKVEKINDCRTIHISAEKNNLSLELNDEKTEVTLKIDNGRTDKFIAKMENGELNIYNFLILKIRSLTLVYFQNLRDFENNLTFWKLPIKC